MKPIREKDPIQIEITNACSNQCVNCSRFVGHHAKPYFMDLETVEKAIDSLVDFPGRIGIMGGEPTLHPQFPEICRLMRKYVPPHRRYLWTAGYNWKKYEKIINKTFGNNVIYNNHSDPTQKHHAMLLSISDMIEDSKARKRLVEKCWVDQRWSASINPKGCFFCEIAAAMDVLFDGPGGLPIERGWWKKGPESFRDQQNRYCFQCGANVPFSSLTLQDDHDLVSQSNYAKLQQVHSPKVKMGHVRLVTEKLTDQHLAGFKEGWQPWDHLGVKKHDGTGNSDYELHPPVRRLVLRMRRAMRIRSSLYRWIEMQVSQLGWRLGLR